MTNKKQAKGITISRGSVNKNVDPVTGKGETAEQSNPQAQPIVDRSFAQQNPIVSPRLVKPKADASKTDQVSAIAKNSVAGKPAPMPQDDSAEDEATE